MAGRGRGRGRGVTNAPPAKPGVRPTNKDSMEQLLTLVKSLSLEADDKELLPIQETASKAATSTEKLEEVAKTVYQRCQEDWKFSPCAAKICCQLESSGLEADGTKFRNILLALIQTDFKNKDKMRDESHTKFLGNVSFLCQVFSQMRDSDGNVLKPMSTGVMESLEMLLDEKASDEEMMCAADQLYAVGKLLQKCVEKIRLTALRNKVKDKIIHAVGGRETRKELLKVTEGFASEWKHYS